jgi:hypothetical protein
MTDQNCTGEAARMSEPVQPASDDWLTRIVVATGTYSWLASMAIHLGLLIALALAMGTIKMAQAIRGGLNIESFVEAPAPEPDLERFVLTEVSYEPTVLDTDALTDEPPATDPLANSLNETLDVLSEPGGRGQSGALQGNSGYEGLGQGPAIRAPAAVGPGGGDPKSGNISPYSTRAKARAVGATKESERAVSAALNWLARHQNADGSWRISHTSRCRVGFCSGPGEAQSDPAATALALLPFLAAGQTHHSDGPYRQHITRGLNWLLKHQAPIGDLSSGQHQMYAHGLATIVLCEAFGMTQDSRIGMAAQSAIRFIESGQNSQGGWRYSHGSHDSDTSVFGWQVMALKSGQMAGLKVQPANLDGARRYLKLCASGAYGSQFGYMPAGRATDTMTSVGLLTSQYLGARRDDPVVVGGIEYLSKHPPALDLRNSYYWYYATQVMHNVPGPEWDAWNRQMRRILIDTQERSGCATGSWDPARPADDPWGRAGGRLMVTSLSVLTLEVYYRYLPLYSLDK